MGLLVGLFLLIVAGLLRVVAPLFSALVQASTSREREFLADATSVEFTRNPRALERALTSLAADNDTLEAANRGTQHLWFRNPVKRGQRPAVGLLSTHPSLAARIDRLRALQGLDPLDAEADGRRRVQRPEREPDDLTATACRPRARSMSMISRTNGALWLTRPSARAHRSRCPVEPVRRLGPRRPAPPDDDRCALTVDGRHRSRARHRTIVAMPIGRQTWRRVAAGHTVAAIG